MTLETNPSVHQILKQDIIFNSHSTIKNIIEIPFFFICFDTDCSPLRFPSKLITMQKISLLALTALACATMYSCQKDQSLTPATEKPISEDVMTKVKALGFGTSTLVRHESGYLVEGDIFLSEQALNSKPSYTLLRFPNTEQYRTFNTVNATNYPTINVALDSRLAALPGYPQALAQLVTRYNNENLSIRFAVVSSGAHITFISGYGNFLASAGFPSSTGVPYSQVTVNVRAVGSGTSSTFINYLTTILTHEAGHCIGYRHTDWFNRALSCGGAATNEGQETTGVGAVLIPGTPAQPSYDNASWMLSCIGNGVNRPFTSNDQTALSYVY